MYEPKTILLIDDETDFVLMLKDLLTEAGYCVVTASNGEEGLSQLKQISPHLIILDMNMPKMGGIAFYHAISSLVDGKTRYPVLVLTARGNLENLFKDLRADGFVTKPFKVDDLLHEIQAIMAKRYGDEAALPAKQHLPLTKRILIIENRQEIFHRLVLEFIRHGYMVSGAQTGTEGIEQAMRDPPDLILIQQALPDLPGDLVSTILKQMPKTAEIALMLYTASSQNLEDAMIHKICKKTGVMNLIESDDFAPLFKKVDSFFRVKPQPSRRVA